MRASRFSSFVRPLLAGRSCLVLGSAPNPRIPADYDPSTWTLICINASGRIAEQIGLGLPAITLMTSAFLSTSNEFSAEARELITGLRTNTLIIRFAGSDPFKKIRRVVSLRFCLLNLDYSFERLLFMSPAIWRPMLAPLVADPESPAEGNVGNVSTGIFGCAMAIRLGASSLSVAGIDPASRGHAYNNLDRPRQHSFADERMVGILRRGGARFTAGDA